LTGRQDLLNLRLTKYRESSGWGSGATANKFIFTCLREWMEQRAQTPREAEAQRQADERAAVAEIKRLNELGSLRKKYLL
jgi:hypothetical protein